MMLLLNMVYKSKTRKQKHDSTTICCGASVRMHSYSVRTTFLIFKKKKSKTRNPHTGLLSEQVDSTHQSRAGGDGCQRG